MKKSIMYAVIVSAMLISCSTDDSQIITKGSDELSISATVEKPITSKALVNDLTTADDKTISVFLQGEGYESKIANYTYNPTTSSWDAPAAESDKIFLLDNDAYVYAFYPKASIYSPGPSSNVDVTIPSTTDFVNTTATDYLFSTARSGVEGQYNYSGHPVVSRKSSDAKKASLFFHHALAKLSFIINKGSTYPSDLTVGKLTSIKLSCTKTSPDDLIFPSAGTMCVSSGDFVSTQNVNTLTFTNTGKNINQYNTTASTIPVAEALVGPTASNALSDGTTSNATLTITIDNKDISINMPQNTTSWLAGKNYVYTITVLGSELRIDCQMVPWIDVNSDLGTVQ